MEIAEEIRRNTIIEDWLIDRLEEMQKKIYDHPEYKNCNTCDYCMKIADEDNIPEKWREHHLKCTRIGKEQWGKTGYCLDH